MKQVRPTEQDVANEMLRLLRRISELEAAELARQRATPDDRCRSERFTPRGILALCAAPMPPPFVVTLN